MTRGDLSRTAFLAHEGRRLLVVEPTRRLDTAAREQLARQVPSAHVDEVIIIEHVPVDRRHNAKIDYPALKGALPRSRQ